MSSAPLAAPSLPAADPELEALAALGQGETERALSVLMGAYGDAVYRFALRLVGRPEAAEDVLQTTFVQAFEGLPRFRGGSTLSTWLFGIARHRALDALKIERRRSRRFHLVAALPDSPTLERPADERLSDRARSHQLARCLQELAPRVRAAVLLRYQQGIAYAEMAELSGEKPAALQMRVARALPVLRRCLERVGGAP